MAEEYKFPDEIEQEKAEKPEVEDDLKVEVVDDTPPEDRGRKPLPKEMVDELEKDDLEEYSDKVKKRLSQMKRSGTTSAVPRKLPYASVRKLCVLLKFGTKRFGSLNSGWVMAKKPTFTKLLKLPIPTLM